MLIYNIITVCGTVVIHWRSERSKKIKIQFHLLETREFEYLPTIYNIL